MQALGLIETRGLVAAVESADAMLKAAEVELLEKTIVGGGLVSITVAGDVGAVKAAVDAGAAAVEQLNKNALVSQHVIPRPHESLEEFIILEKPLSVKEADAEVEEHTIQKTTSENASIEVHKEYLDEQMKTVGVETGMELLNDINVQTLRKLASEYEDFAVTSESSAKANKKRLLAEFKKYYGQSQH